jgi:hypothetical protein
MFAGRVRDWHQARCHRSISNIAFDEFSDHYRARSAIAFATADLRALKIFVIPNKVEHGCAAGKARLDIHVVEDELDHAINLTAETERRGVMVIAVRLCVSAV